MIDIMPIRCAGCGERFRVGERPKRVPHTIGDVTYGRVWVHLGTCELEAQR